MSLVTPHTLDTVARSGSTNRRALGLGLLGLAAGSTLLAAALRHPVVVALWITVIAGVAIAFSKFEETYSADHDEIVHRNWFRTVVLKKHEVVTIETPDHEGPVRSVLVADAAGNAISIPLSRLRADAALAASIEHLSAR